MPLTDAQIEQRRRAGQASSRAKARAARRNGRKGGRPADPRVRQIMRQRGVSRQRAWQILKSGRS